MDGGNLNVAPFYIVNNAIMLIYGDQRQTKKAYFT